jgi:hypothetical protein
MVFLVFHALLALFRLLFGSINSTFYISLHQGYVRHDVFSGCYHENSTISLSDFQLRLLCFTDTSSIKCKFWSSGKFVFLNVDTYYSKVNKR